MATKRKDPEVQPERTKLTIDKAKFKAQLVEVLEIGQELMDRQIGTLTELEKFRSDYSDWDDFNSEFLKASFNVERNEYRHDYNTCTNSLGMDDYISGRYKPYEPNYQLERTKKEVNAKLKNLQQLLNKINLIPSLVEPSLITEILESDKATPLAYLHPTVQDKAGKLFMQGHYYQAILTTYIALINAVQNKSLLKLDNTDLMRQAFSPKNTILKVSDDAGEQEGFMHLFEGAVMGIRNPKAHRIIDQKDYQRTLEWLSFASVLFRVLDDSQKL